jgi:hypothetical protein
MSKPKIDTHTQSMLERGRRFAKLLPEGYRLMGVDPGFLFVSDKHRASLDMTEAQVDSILAQIEGCEQSMLRQAEIFDAENNQLEAEVTRLRARLAVDEEIPAKGGLR